MQAVHLMSLPQRDMTEYLFEDRPPFPIDVERTEGSYVIDRNGKRFLDFVMGWSVGNAGWGIQEMKEVVSSFSGPTYVTPRQIYQKWDHLAEKLVNLLPSKKGTCFKATGGTEAVEIALKIAKAHNHRKRFIAFKEAYHGQSLACMDLVGIPEHEKAFGPFSDYTRLEAENWESTTEKAVKEIKSKNVCAFISEPLICNLGVIIPPKSFFQAVQEACRETDTVFIIDEVATGFGRTGKWFGFEHHDIEPDIVTIAKGFSSGYAPIGGVIAMPDVAEGMRFEFSNYSTYGWHPLGVEAALKNIDYIKKNSLLKKSEESGAYLMEKLSEFNPEGRGLCIGFGIKNSSLAADCMKDGLITTSLGNRIALFPALNVTKEDMDKAVDILKKHF